VYQNLHTNKEMLDDLFTYNYHTNQLFIDALRKAEITDEKAIELLSHLLNAHAIWLGRIEKKIPLYSVWETHAINACEQLNLSNYHQSQHLLKNLDTADLEAVIDYQNTKGTRYQNKIRDILLHIINHSTHHRAQISLLIRQQGYPPPVSDYIFHKRNPS
jgi:uncharacterized damage-inducible protein DinB